MHLVPYPISLGLHSQTDIVDAVNDLNARLQAVETAHAIIADVERHTDPCVGGLGRFLRERIADFEKQPTAPASAPAHTETVCPVCGGDCPGNGCDNQPAAPGDDAGKTAVLSALMKLYYYDHGCMVQVTEACALAVHNAIRAGQVPGRWDDADGIPSDDWKELRKVLGVGPLESERYRVQAAIRLIQSMRKELSDRMTEIAKLTRELVNYQNSNETAITQRDQARADLGRADKAFSSLYDDHERLKEDKALCESENREKQAVIERFMEGEQKADAELAEAKALLRDVSKNGERLTFNSWYQTNRHRFDHIVAAGGGIK